MKKSQMIGIMVLRRSRNYFFIYFTLIIAGCNTSDTTLTTDLDVKSIVDFDTIIITRTSSISPVITDTFYSEKEHCLSYTEVLNQFYSADSITFSGDPKLITTQELNNRINIIDYSPFISIDYVIYELYEYGPVLIKNNNNLINEELSMNYHSSIDSISLDSIVKYLRGFHERNRKSKPEVITIDK